MCVTCSQYTQILEMFSFKHLCLLVFTDEKLKCILITNITDERESVQKKTFQKWVNSHLIRMSCRIQDLYIDLRDGKMLMKLLEILSGERLVWKLWQYFSSSLIICRQDPNCPILILLIAYNVIYVYIYMCI